MRPTKYNKRITIQTRTKTENEVKGWKNVWSDWYTCWASVIPVKGIKRMEYGQLGFTTMYEVEMRKRVSNVHSECQVVYGGNAYQIQNFYADDERVYLDIAKK